MKTKTILQVLGAGVLVVGAIFAVIPTYRTTTLSLIGHQYDGTIVENIIIHDTGGDGIVLRDVDNVTIRNCEIYNVSEGIALSSLGNTKNITIENCNIHDTGRNGIIVKQHPGYNQTGVIIRNNVITNTGTSSTSGAYHGIYMQATDNTIAGNVIDTSTGNGVSIRSSGYVGNNRISNTAKSCIRYFSDNVTGATKKLQIENNLCVNPAGDYPAISILWGGNAAVVTDFQVRFNTIIGGLNSFQVQSSQFSSAQVAVYGNLFTKALATNYIDYNAGNLLATEPFSADYSLSAGNLAINYAASVRDWPAVDIDGVTRQSIDAGAFAYQGAAPGTQTSVPSDTPTATRTLLPATPTRTSTPVATPTHTQTAIPTITPAFDSRCDAKYLPFVCIYKP